MRTVRLNSAGAGYIKGFIIVAGIAVLSLGLVPEAAAGHDDDFRRASNIDYYPGIANLESAQLDVNLASVIHQENLQIIKILQGLEERLNKLEMSIRTIERQVSGNR